MGVFVPLKFATKTRRHCENSVLIYNMCIGCVDGVILRAIDAGADA